MVRFEIHCTVYVTPSTQNSLHFFSIPVSPPRPKMMCLCTGFVVDKEDSSVTRSDTYFRDLFKQTGFHLYKTRVSSSTFRVNDGVCYVTNLCSTENGAICISMTNFNFWHVSLMGFLYFASDKVDWCLFWQLQKGFPKDLFAVRMYAVTPEPVSATPATNQVRTRRHANQPRKIV